MGQRECGGVPAGELQPFVVGVFVSLPEGLLAVGAVEALEVVVVVAYDEALLVEAHVLAAGLARALPENDDGAEIQFRTS